MSEFLHEHGAPKLSSEDPIVHIERVGRMLTGKRLITEGTYFAAIAEISQEKLEVPIVGTLREALTKLSKARKTPISNIPSVPTQPTTNPVVQSTMKKPELVASSKSALWYKDANCLGKDLELFYSNSPQDKKVAKFICNRCIVKRECLQTALDLDDQFGIWGGLTERERNRISRNR